MTEHVKTAPSVTVTYGTTGASKTSNELGMRAMQERAYMKRGEQYLLIKSPPASGKSRALMFIALDKLANQGMRQAIIVVPERSIGASFRDTALSRHGFWADWSVAPQWNLCNAPGADDPKVARGKPPEDLDDAALLAELGVSPDEDVPITDLRHVRPRAEIRAAEEIADKAKCEDFSQFEPLFAAVREDIKSGRRETRRYARMAGIKQGEFFIVNGQFAYVAEVGEEFETEYDRRDSRLRVVFDNGTESNLLLRSLQRALHRDETGRRVTDPNAGPLFDQQLEAEGRETGTIYVLRSLSDHPDVARNREIIHKIGVTGGEVEKRFANAQKDPTFLMAPVEIVATFRLIDINRTALENLIHRFFAPARLDIVIRDRFGESVRPREWFVAPLPAIQDAVEKIQDGTLHHYEYRPAQAALVRRE